MATETTLAIPAEIVPRFVKALHLELGTAAQAISQTSLEHEQVAHPEWYAEPLGQFDRLRALLNAIGWQAPASALVIDAVSHRLAIAAGLRTAAEIMEGDDTYPEYEPVLQAALMRRLAYTAETAGRTRKERKGWYERNEPSERERDMLRLRLVEGLSLREIGERFGVTGGRVNQILFFCFHVKGVPPAIRAKRQQRRKHTRTDDDA
jgi:Sigma-70, region 4